MTRFIPLKPNEGIHSEDVLEHLEKLKRTEEEIYRHHQTNNLEELLNVAERRFQLSYHISTEFSILSKDEKLMEMQENQEHFKIIEKHLKELLTLIKNQLYELQNSKVMVNSQRRFQVLNGNKTIDTQSEITTKLNKIEEIIHSQAGVILKSIRNLEGEI